MTDLKSQLVQSVTQMSAGSSAGLKVKGALTPLLRLCVFTPIPLLLAYLINVPILREALIFTGIMPYWAVVGAYTVLLFRNPAMLQSEEFQIKEQAIQITRVQGGELHERLLAFLGTGSSKEDAS